MTGKEEWIFEIGEPVTTQKNDEMLIQENKNKNVSIF